MDGKEAIINRIIDDANVKAEQILEQANKASQQKIKEAKEWENAYYVEQEKLLDREVLDIIERKVTSANLDKRKIILQAKQELIGKVFEQVKNQLSKLDKKQYLSLVEKLITVSADDGDIVVLSKDNVLIKDDIAKLEVYKNKNLTVDDKKGKFIGGVMLIGKTSDKDLTFESLVNSNVESLTKVVADKLF